jgi:hypothetical protein
MTWQDISTAPKDGSKVILAKIIPASEDREASVWWACMGHWRDETPLSESDFSTARYPAFFSAAITSVKNRRSAGWTDGMDNLGAPTHWMPVPEPASPQQEGDTP